MMNNFQQNITPEEIEKLPLNQFEGEIVLIEKPEQIDAAIDELRNTRYLGFDTETRPSFKKGQQNQNKVALLQLSTGEKAYLFRVNKIGLPKQLVRILEDVSITKIGLAINDDLKILKKITRFKEKGFVDLAPYSSENFDIECNGLKKLTAIILGFRISKSQQLSNWENDQLTEAQKIYAATDAWVCYEIYTKLRETE